MVLIGTMRILRLHLAGRRSPRAAAKLAEPRSNLVQDDKLGAVELVAVIVGVGIDLAEVARYRFDERKLAWFARKIYTEDEMAYAMRKRNWAERLAGFFAAKEATRKAFGHAIPWRWVGVGHERSGKPTIELRERAAALMRGRGVRTIHLSITHTAHGRRGRASFSKRDLRPDAGSRCAPPTRQRSRASARTR